MSKTEYSMKLGNGWIRNRVESTANVSDYSTTNKCDFMPTITKHTSAEKLLIDAPVRSSGKIMRSVNCNIADLFVNDYTDAIKCSVSPHQLIGKKMSKYKI